MKRQSQKHPTKREIDPRELNPHRRGVVEPDLNPDDFEPRLPSRVLRERGGIIGHLKSSRSRADRLGKRGSSRRQAGVRGWSHGSKVFPQRVVVKARVVAGKGASSLERMRKHRTYLSRSGTGLTGRSPQFFDASGYCSSEQLQRQAPAWVDDPHHFRLIISPEQGARLELDDYVRNVMRQVEEDLKTKLEWYGVSHHNTDNAHAHVVLRGMDDKGNPLLISREYLSHGLRNVAEREASVRLGMRQPEDLDRGIEKMLFEERFTWIDKQLVKERDLSGEGIVRVLPLSPDAREFAKKARLSKLKRLAFLESKGLCHEERTGVWKIEDKLEEVLRELGQRRSIERLVAPSLMGREELKQDLLIYKESAEFGPKEIVGTVLAKNLIDELQDKKFILVSGADGRNHFIPLGRLSESAGFECRVGQVVRVVGQKATKTRAEEVIHRYLGQREGNFSLELFRGYLEKEIEAGRWALPTGLSLDEYLSRFATRCVALERAGVIEPLGATSEWRVPQDVVERAKGLDKVSRKRLRFSVIPESYRTVREEIGVEGASWLDRIIAEGHMAQKATGAFGLEVSRALKERGEILKGRGQSQSRELYEQLLVQEEKNLKARLTKKLSRRYTTLVPNRELEGELLQYDLLGDGYRMVIGLEDASFVTRAVPTREERMEVGTRVSISLIQDRERGTSSLKLTKIGGDSRSKERSKTFKR